MSKKTDGIHHITAIVGDPQENVDFYSGLLGLRFVKKTINFDDPGTYHLYFGDEEASPGTIITFFPWGDAQKGEIGSGQVGVTSYAVPIGALDFWKNRLNSFHISFTQEERFGETYIQFEDPHGLQLELVEREEGKNSTWSFGGITDAKAIKGFAGATLYSSEPDNTTKLLEDVMGLERLGVEGDFIRFKAVGSIGNVIDVKKSVLPNGTTGVGTVHHIAWRAKDNNDQLDWQQHVSENGYEVTDVRDRNYFNAIYFREHGNILFEIATDPPGFAVDEDPNKLGEKLMLPKWYEPNREKIENLLQPIEIRELD